MKNLILREGDTVSIVGKVLNDFRYGSNASGEKVYVQTSGFNRFFAEPSDVELLRRGFKPGEKAIHPDFDNEVEIVHVSGDYAWVTHGDGFNNVVMIGDLDLPPREEEKAAPISAEEFAKVT